MTKITPVRGTDIIEISVSSEKPELAAHIANAIAEVVVTGSVKQSFSFEKDILNWLYEQVSGLRKELDDSATRIREFREGIGGLDLVTEYDATWERLQELQESLSATQSERQKAETAYNNLQNYLKTGTKLEDLPQVQMDDTYKQKKSEILGLKKTISELSQTYQPNHPTIVEMSKKIAEFETGMSVRAEEVVSEIENKYKLATAREEELQRLAEAENEKLLKLEEQRDKYQSLLDDLKEKDRIYSEFIKKIDTEFTGGVTIQRAELVEEAYLPEEKAGPGFGLVLSLGILAGVIIGGIYNMVTGEEAVSYARRPAQAPRAKERKDIYIERVKGDEGLEAKKPEPEAKESEEAPGGPLPKPRRIHIEEEKEVKEEKPESEGEQE
jgi:uncharacterized protein involved in exopolysaccharide biosynthesis